MITRLASDTKFDIVSIGQTSLDTIQNDYGRASDILGGGGAYVAVIAATLRARTALVSRVGHDFREAVDLFRQVGIDLDGLHEVIGNSTRIRLVYRGERLKELEISDGVGKGIVIDDLPQHYFSTKVAHIAPAPYATQLLTIKQMKENGALVSFAPHDDLKGMQVPEVRRLLQSVDLLFANEFEMISMSGEHSLKDAITTLHLAGPSLIVATQGSKGATISSSGETIFVPALKPLKTVDYVGAGDAFAATFLVGLLRGFQLATCGTFAAAVAACIIGDFGLVVPRKEQINELLRNNESLLSSWKMSPVVLDDLIQEAS